MTHTDHAAPFGMLPRKTRPAQTPVTRVKGMDAKQITHAFTSIIIANFPVSGETK